MHKSTGLGYQRILRCALAALLSPALCARAQFIFPPPSSNKVDWLRFTIDDSLQLHFNSNFSYTKIMLYQLNNATFQYIPGARSIPLRLRYQQWTIDMTNSFDIRQGNCFYLEFAEDVAAGESAAGLSNVTYASVQCNITDPYNGACTGAAIPSSVTPSVSSPTPPVTVPVTSGVQSGVETTVSTTATATASSSGSSAMEIVCTGRTVLCLAIGTLVMVW
jgi:hypothetical protein